MEKCPESDESKAWAEETLIRWFDKDSEAERNFVIKAWIENCIEADESGPLPMSIAREAYDKAIKRWMGSKGIEIRIAQSRAIPDELLGFIVTYTTPRHGTVLVFVYVKSKYRSDVAGKNRATFRVKTKRGVCSLLMKAASLKPGEPYVYCFKNWNWHLVTKHSKQWAIGTWNPKPTKFLDSNFKEGNE